MRKKVVKEIVKWGAGLVLVLGLIGGWQWYQKQGEKVDRFEDLLAEHNQVLKDLKTKTLKQYLNSQQVEAAKELNEKIIVGYEDIFKINQELSELGKGMVDKEKRLVVEKIDKVDQLSYEYHQKLKDCLELYLAENYEEYTACQEEVNRVSLEASQLTEELIKQGLGKAMN